MNKRMLWALLLGISAARSVLAVQITDGSLTIPGGQIYYKLLSEEATCGRTPLVCVNGGPGLSHDHQLGVATLSMPLLLCYGQFDLLLSRTADRVTNAQKVLLQNCAHLTFMENPDLYARVTGKFLKECDKN